MPRSARSRLALCLLPAIIFSCGEATPTPVPPPPPTLSVAASAAPTETAYVAPADSPLPTLRTGALEPMEHREILPATLALRHLGDAFETLALEIELPGGMSGWGDELGRAVVATSGPASDPKPYAFLSGPLPGPAPANRQQALVWVRRPKALAGKALDGEAFTAATSDFEHPGHHFRFRLNETDAKAKSDPKALEQWSAMLGQHLKAWSHAPGAFHQFAADRLKTVFGKPEKKPAAPGARPTPPPRLRGSELARLMETTTGAASIQEALQTDRALFIAAAKDKPTIPIASINGPKLKTHPWNEMLKALGASPPAEPLAAAAPAEFYYARASNLGVLLDLFDQIESWGTPAANTLDRVAEDRGLAARYEAELGLSRGPLTRALGPEVIVDLALVGSDPYVREGTDLTLIFRVKSKTLFEAALASALSTHGSAHGGLTQSQSSQGGVTIKIARSADGAVHQHRVSSGDLEIVSNSAGAIGRVIEAMSGKRARLADEQDFRYMLARDAGQKADLLAFLSDRFVAEVVGPKQKILQARREIALAELTTPGFAALLHGFVNGRSPKDADELVASKLLTKADLVHGSGAAITWSPSNAARSTFGTPAALTPLIDLSPASVVTETEKQAYEFFARTYEGYWSTYIDPVAIRASLDPPGDKERSLSVDVRILPLIDSSEYRTLHREVGETHVRADPIESGLRVVSAIGDESRLRREVRGFARDIPGLRDIKLEWLGDWAMIGIADRNAAASVALHTIGREIEVPARSGGRRRDRDEIAMIARLPLYFGVGVRSTAGVALALTALHKLADDTVPGMLTWGPWATHRGVPIVRVMVKSGALFAGGDIAVYYALAEGALLISLDEGVLRWAIDARALGKGPSSLGPNDTPGAAPQFAFDLGGAKGGGIWTGLGWMLEAASLDTARRSRSTAEALFFGAPERAGDPRAVRDLARAYFGAVPLTPSGGVYELARDGVRDPIRGTQHAPVYPEVPVAGSPVAKLLGALARFRGELSFDDEGKPAQARTPLQSLHARVKLGLRSP